MLTALIIGDGSTSVEKELFSAILKKGGGVVPYLSETLNSALRLSFDILHQFTYIYLIPGNLFPRLPSETQINLVNYVMDGGILVCTPFAAWSSYFRGNEILQQVLPVRCSGYYENKTLRLQKGEIPLHQEMKSTRYCGCSFIASGEELTVIDGGELICSCEIDGTPNVFSARRRSRRGYTLYLNATHHSSAGSLQVWSSDGKPSPIYELMDSWSLQCYLDVEKANQGNMVRFIIETGAQFLEPEWENSG